MPSYNNKSQLRNSRKSKATAAASHMETARTLLSFIIQPPKSRRGKQIVYSLLALLILCTSGMYAIGEGYILSQKNTPLTMGVSFVPDYATFLGVSPQATMDALINQVGVRQFRLTSYWSDIETSPGHYDFSTLDWEFAKADAAHASVNLAIGLRQPRYPECHAPSFYNTAAPESVWYPQLKAFMTAVIERYKDNPALKAYQLENEYFLKGFGTCADFSRSRLVNEDQLVTKLDPSHPIIIGRSNNDVGWPIGKPTPNEFSVSVYQRVWDANLTHRYLEYPFPSWYYAFLAGWQKIFTGKNMIIGELQAEAWAPDSKTIPEISIAEQNKSMNATRLTNTISFGKATGMKTIDLWGAEYWYYRQQVLHDPSLMQAAKKAFVITNKT